MKKRIRKGCAFLLCLCLCISLSPAAHAATGDEVRAAKKVISVVYDDSGSMAGERWVYANYAMQALVSLLNTQDELFITYMTDPDQANRADLKNIEKVVDGFRKLNQMGDTPAQAIDTARKALEGVKEQDSSTQFWLVVLTDGDFQGLDTDLTSKLLQARTSPASNGTYPNVVYLRMGSNDPGVSADPRNGLYTYSAKTGSDIFNVMQQMAMLISGRITAQKIETVDDYTIRVSSDLPLYSLSVLSQETGASVSEATMESGKLDIVRNIGLSASDPFNASRLSLTGNAAILSCNGSAYIPSGSYEIRFTEPVRVDQLVIQYEPAIEIRLNVSKDGDPVDDLQSLQEGDSIEVTLIPVVPGTDQEIPQSDLPEGTGWGIIHEFGGKEADRADGRKLSIQGLQQGENLLRGVMQIPGYAPLLYDQTFTVAKGAVEYGVTVRQPEVVIYERGRLGAGNVEGEDVSFQITADGAAVDKQRLKELDVHLQVVKNGVDCDNSGVKGFFNRLGRFPVACSLELDDSGAYVLRPKSPLPFTAFALMAGEYTVRVCLDRDETAVAEGHFVVQAAAGDWVNLIWFLLMCLAILTLLYVIFIKYKFKNQTIRGEIYDISTDESQSSISKFGPKRIGPLTGIFSLGRASRFRYRGLELEASPFGGIIITGKSIAKSVYKYGNSSSDPSVYAHSISESLKCTEKRDGDRQTRQAADQMLGTRRVYFVSSKTSSTMWCLYVQGKKK